VVTERIEADETRKRLKAFGVMVTEYQARTRELLERRAAAATADAEESIRREAAELSAELNRALRDITNHVLQLQSDVLMELVAREPAGDQSRGS
jgi:F0F1-type ATP synthase membrane subunit b/b'